MNKTPTFTRTSYAALAALAASGALQWANGRTARYAPPADPGHFVSNGGRSRSHTADDARAFRKRIAKRRAKKGYR